MQVYLPIAEVSVDLFTLLALGGGVGFISGLFGIGGGFLSTPLLILIGVPPAVAVGSQASQLVAVSISGVIGHWRRGRVDFKMGGVMLAGGICGSFIGVWLFGILKEMGQIDLFISLSFVFLLGFIATLMMCEGLLTSFLRKSNRKKKKRRWFKYLPLKTRFKKSGIYMSMLAPFTIGCFVSILVSTLGIGGGFLMVPAMVYLLRIPPSMVGGTSLFQIMFVTGIVTFLQAFKYQTVDMVLATLMLIGGVIGVQFGVQLSTKLKGEYARLLLASIIMVVCIRLGFDLITMPEDLYFVE